VGLSGVGLSGVGWRASVCVGWGSVMGRSGWLDLVAQKNLVELFLLGEDLVVGVGFCWGCGVCGVVVVVVVVVIVV
jgi:hypothetical protein